MISNDEEVALTLNIDDKLRRRDLARTRGDSDAPEISVFLPVYNEEPNLRPLHAKLDEALDSAGSHRGDHLRRRRFDRRQSESPARDCAATDPRVRVVALRRNYGQTAAMAAGIDAAQGEVLIPMDADLQNDPADIARLLEKLDEGYDVVSGWRKNRQDKLITRKIPSMIANRLISWIGGVPLHDYGCSLKAYRRESLAGRAALRRDAPLHSDLRVVGRRARHGNSGRASCAHDGQIEIRTVAHDQSRLRSDDDQVHGVVSDETDLRLWLVWHA